MGDLHLKQLLTLFSSLVLSFISYAEPLGFPATFKTSSLEIATLEQYETRVRAKFTNLEIQFENVESVTYNDKVYKGLIVTAQGMMGSNKVNQKLTYILLHKDLWRMTFINGETCVLGELLRNGQWVKDWACDTLEFPLASEFADIFIIDNANADLAQISTDWGRQVELITEEEVQPEAEKTQSLGDIKKFLLDNGSTWRTENSTWTSLSDPSMPPQPAIKIYVSGQLNSTDRFEQSFLYFIDGDLLRLKEISGKVCQFVERVNKEICDDLYYPTRSTPFQLVLLNTLDVTESSNSIVSPVIENTSGPKLSCVGISNNFLMSLRFHFERGLFSQQDIGNYRRALSELANVSDPMRIFLSETTFEKYKNINQSPYPMDEFLNNLQVEFNKGSAGSCDSLLTYVEELKTEVLSQNQKFAQLLKMIEDKDFNAQVIESSIDQNDEKTMKFWQVIKASFDPALSNYPEKSLDVAAANLRRYLRDSLDRLNSPEELLTAAFVRQDAYSQLLTESLVVQTEETLSGFGKRKYFGLRVLSGIKNHYIGSVHPETQKNFDLSIGDQIVSLNQKSADQMTALEIDQILIKTDQVIAMSVNRNGQVLDINLMASPIDPLKSTYSTEVLVQSPQEKYLKIKISSFESGLAESLYTEVKNTMAMHDLNGIIIDLQSNPGGYAQEAINLLSFFMKDQTLAYYKRGSRALETATSLKSIDEFYISDSIPVIVQVNRYSQSASEIFASSIKDLNRGLIVGEKTFGKLVGQDFFPVLVNSRDLGMVITTTEYFSPTGRSLNGIGVEADLVIYSGEQSPFNDGTGVGRPYNVGFQPVLYRGFLTSEQLNLIQNNIDLDNTDIDQVSMDLFSAAQNFIFATNQ